MFRRSVCYVSIDKTSTAFLVLLHRITQISIALFSISDFTSYLLYIYYWFLINTSIIFLLLFVNHNITASYTIYSVLGSP